MGNELCNKGKRIDYILRYRPDLAAAVVEAKPDYATSADERDVERV
jgi:hypothetical protein